MPLDRVPGPSFSAGQDALGVGDALVIVAAGQQMPVGVERQRQRRVARPALALLEINTRGEPTGYGVVPEAVQAVGLHAGLGGEGREQPADVGQRIRAISGVAEHEAAAGRLLKFPGSQGLRAGLAKGNGAACGV